jgi:hypothetical protein
VSGGNPANFFALADIHVEGAAAVFDSASFEKGTVTPNGILTYFGPVGCSPNESSAGERGGCRAPIQQCDADQLRFAGSDHGKSRHNSTRLQRQHNRDPYSASGRGESLPVYPNRDGEGPRQHREPGRYS